MSMVCDRIAEATCLTASARALMANVIESPAAAIAIMIPNVGSMLFSYTVGRSCGYDILHNTVPALNGPLNSLILHSPVSTKIVPRPSP